MDDAISIKDIFFIGGVLATIAGAYFAIKYQGISNSKDIESAKDSNEEQWKKINHINDEITSRSGTPKANRGKYKAETVYDFKGNKREKTAK